MSDIIFSPSRRMTLTDQHIARRRENKGDGIPMYLRGVDFDKHIKDSFYIPAIRGDMTSIIARPSNGKTGFMIRWARARAKWLIDHNFQNKVVVYITTETAIENLSTFLLVADAREQGRINKTATDFAVGDISDEEWAEFQKINSDSVLAPIWMIGHSLNRDAKRPLLYAEIVNEALQEIQKWNSDKTEIDVIFIDYLQRFPIPPKQDMRTTFINYMDSFKNMALEFNTHTIVGVQAKREVEARKWPVPMLSDGMETANIEQSSQNVFSLMRPRMYFQEGESFGDKSPMIVKKNHLLLTCLKQSMGEPNWHKWLNFEPEYNRLDLLEEREVDFGSHYNE